MKLYELVTKINKETMIAILAGPVIYATMARDLKFIPVEVLNSEVLEIRKGSLIEIEVEHEGI